MSAETDPSASLQLLLFVDRRPTSLPQIQRIRSRLQHLQSQYSFHLQTIDITEEPYLAEYFKLVASPALVKICPEPRQILAGTELITQLETCWPRWLAAVDSSNPPSSPQVPVVDTSVLIQFTDEIFRLKQRQQELEEQLQFKNRMISALAHDLRNPLTATSIALETMEMGLYPRAPGASPLSPEVMAQLLHHARVQTATINRMITSILQSNPNSQQALTMEPRPFELGTLAQEVLNLLQAQGEAKHLHFKTDLPADLPPVYGDPEQIRQVLMNLLDNAIKYTPAQGIVQIYAVHRTTRKIQVSVQDTGPGIPADQQQRIFEDHVRLDRDKNQTGYGIGLALCRRIVQSHYGQIWVDSVLGQGSCFHFTLPVHQE